MKFAMPRHSLRRALLGGAVGALLVAVAVTGCSSSSGAKTTPSSAASSSNSRRGFNGLNAGLRTALESEAGKACLQAAGITVPAFPSGTRPSGTRPSGSPPPGQPPFDGSAPPSGAPRSGARRSGVNGQSAQQFQKILGTLKACGIDVATPAPTP